MPEITRRGFVGACGAVAGAVGSGAGSVGAAEAPRIADFTGDGIPLTPAEYAALLGRLTSAGTRSDEYSRGGPVEALEAQFARLLGKEAAVFMPTGTLANHLAVRALAGGRRRVAVQEVSHFYNDSGDCAQTLSALNLVPLAPGKATFTWDDVAALLERTGSGRVATGVGAISIESPVRRLHHESFDFGQMQRIAREARSRGIGLHLDGARLFVAAAYSRRPPAEYAALFDTVYVSLWKCFNSGSGAVLAGPRALLAEMYHARRMFGGALWNAWPFALVASHYADGYLERLGRAVRVGEELIAALASDAAFQVRRVPNGTSAFFLQVRGGDPSRLRQRLADQGVGLPEAQGDGFWLRVNETLAAASAPALAQAFRKALAG